MGSPAQKTPTVTLEEQTREKLLLGFEIYPFISQSMIHQAVGTSIPVDFWKPILEDLIEEGLITVTVTNAKTLTGRAQSYTIYHLSKNKYVYGNGDV